MSSKIEIRKLAELACGTSRDSPEYKRFIAALNPTLLLDLTAPVVERQPEPACVGDLERFESNGEDFVKVHDVIDMLANIKSAPPELAELQATIAQLRIDLCNQTSLTEQANHHKAQRGQTIDELTAEIERLKGGQGEPVASEAELIAAGFGYPMSKEDAVKAYKASLQPRTDHPSNEDCEWCHGCGHDHYGDPCVGCCSSANAIYLYRRKGNKEFATCDRLRFVELSSHKMFDTKICFASNTSQPAPVSSELVQLLERAKVYARGPFLDEINACLENQTAPVSVVPDERAEFVAWVRREWPQAPLSYVRDLLPKSDARYGEYCDPALQRAWVGWQALACLDKVKEMNK